VFPEDRSSEKRDIEEGEENPVKRRRVLSFNEQTLNGSEDEEDGDFLLAEEHEETQS